MIRGKGITNYHLVICTILSTPVPRDQYNTEYGLLRTRWRITDYRKRYRSYLQLLRIYPIRHQISSPCTYEQAENIPRTDDLYSPSPVQGGYSIQYTYPHTPYLRTINVAPLGCSFKTRELVGTSERVFMPISFPYQSFEHDHPGRMNRTWFHP